MTNEPDPSVIGQDGAILNFMKDIEDAARYSNGYVLELGCGKGTGSTVAIQRGLRKHARPLHISVDASDRMEWTPGVEWWAFIEGDTRDAATAADVMAITPRHPGLIFIDTDHTYAQMKGELELWSRLASDDTVWLFHDTHMHGRPDEYGMVKAILEFAETNVWAYEDYRVEQHGLGRMFRNNE